MPAAAESRVISETGEESPAIDRPSRARDDSRVLALKAESESLERKLVDLGEYEGLFSSVCADLIFRYSKTVIALETIVWKPAASFALQGAEDEVTALAQKLQASADEGRLFDPEAVTLVRKYITACATFGAAIRQQRLLSQTKAWDGLPIEIGRLERRLAECAEEGVLFDFKIAMLLIRYVRSVAEFGETTDATTRPVRSGGPGHP